MKIEIKNNRAARKTLRDTTVIVIGGFWNQGKYYTGEAACDFVVNKCSGNTKKIEEYQRFIKSCNGAFAFCIKTDLFVLASVDKVRSIPLFYSDKCITDKLKNHGGIDTLGRIELLSSSYTIGNRTVLAGWSVLKPGEFLFSSLDTGFIINVYNYYLHTHLINEQINEQEIEKQFILISEQVITRVLQSLQGKKVMIALSGGYDSRYVACMLKEYGINDIVAYTYGKKSSYEVKTSKEVAEKLGYEWNYIKYSEELWNRIAMDGIIDKYIDYAFMGDGTPCFQEIPALSELRKKYNPEEYCILPGYCGDLFGGSYLLPMIAEQISLTEFALFLYERHFTFRRNRKMEREEILHDIEKSLGNQESFFYADAASVNENWFVSHKVAKFVVNAVRMFEFFGYEWRLPLWDDDLLSLWYSVSLDYRGIQKNLYKELLFTHYFSKYDVMQTKPASYSKKPSSGIMKTIKQNIKKANSYLAIHKGIHIIPQRDINNFAVLERYLLQNITDHTRLNYGQLDVNAYVARRVMEKNETNT